jgi:hypothetical protein
VTGEKYYCLFIVDVEETWANVVGRFSWRYML